MTLAMAIWTLIVAMPPNLQPCEDCNAWAQEIADSCEVAGHVLEVNPWALAAIAHHETRFDPKRKSPTGKGVGLWGLNPRTRHGVRAKAWCEVHDSICTLSHAIEAAAYLAWERKRCGGWDGALRSYGSGRCDGPAKYSRGVALSLAKLRGVK